MPQTQRLDVSEDRKIVTEHHLNPQTFRNHGNSSGLGDQGPLKTQDIPALMESNLHSGHEVQSSGQQKPPIQLTNTPLHQQNISAPRHPSLSVKSSSSHTDAERGSYGDTTHTIYPPDETEVHTKAESLQKLSAKMDALRAERAQHVNDIQILEKRIEQSEVVCGRMIQDYLELGRGIQLKQKHIAEDKEKLSREHRSEKRIDEMVDSTLARIALLVRQNDEEL